MLRRMFQASPTIRFDQPDASHKMRDIWALAAENCGLRSPTLTQKFALLFVAGVDGDQEFLNIAL